MKRIKKSGPAIFMYCVIAITVVTSIKRMEGESVNI